MRALSPPAVRDLGGAQHPPKRHVRGVMAVDPTMRRREEDGVGRALAHVRLVAQQMCHQRRRHRDEPVLTELALVNREDAVDQVDSADPQMQRFAQAKPAAVEHAEERSHHPVPIWRKHVWQEPVERSEEPRGLVGTEDPGPEVTVLQ